MGKKSKKSDRKKYAEYYPTYHYPTYYPTYYYPTYYSTYVCEEDEEGYDINRISLSSHS